MANFTLRAGLVEIADSLIGVLKDGKIDGICSARGMFGEVFKILFDRLVQEGYRCTLDGYPILGSYDENKGKYDGAIGALQDNEYDLLLIPVYYPLIDPEEEYFFYTGNVYEDTMFIFSGYLISNQKHVGDLFSMFTMVPYGLWIGYFLSFIAFVCVSWLGTRLLREKYSSLWMTTCAFLDQDNYPSTSRFVSVLSFVVMVGMFFMMAYAGNCMSTDLVSIDKPIAVTSYDDIINRGIKAAFTKVLPEWETFQNAPPGSKERALFDNSENVGLNPVTVLGFMETGIKQETVLIGRRLVATSAALTLAGFPAWPPEGRAYVAPDENAKKYTNVFVLSLRLKGTAVQRLLSKVIGRLGEAGFVHYAFEHGITAIAESVHNERGALPSHREKVTSKVEEQSADIVAIEWRHVRNVLLMLIGGAVGSGIVTIIEILHYRFINLI